MKARLCGRCGNLVIQGEECCRKPRRNTNSDGYDRRWQRFRQRVIVKRIKEGRMQCAMCGKAFGGQRIHADHIQPVSGQDDPLFFDESNIQLLHPDCHGQKTAEDVRQGKTR